MFSRATPFRRAQPFDDAELGALMLTRRAWRGSLQLDGHGWIPLAVPGSRSGPDEAALGVARTIHGHYERCRAVIDAALLDHRSATLQEHGSSGHDTALRPVSAAVISLDRLPTIQLAYRVDWDDDHVLGACLRDGEFVELNGSILEP